MTNNFKKILVLSPHTDDAELGCGGTINKFLKQGKEIYWAVFSKAFVSERNFDVLKELEKSAKILKVTNLSIFDYPVRHLPEYRQEILDKMWKIKRKINPDLIFLPSSKDINQDHQVIFKEGLRAFKNITILGYEYPWNLFEFNTTCFIRLTEEDILKKIEAINQYKSQSHRPYINREFVKNLAQVRGMQISVPYAEAFQVIRLILE